MNTLQWISSAHLGLRAELWSSSHAKKTVCSDCAWTSADWIKSWRRTNILYLALLTFFTACARPKSIQKSTSGMPTIWSKSERVMNGRQLSRLATAPLNGTFMSMDANPNMYSILIPPVSNTFHFCHHPQPHHRNPTMLNPSSIIHHLSSMATPDIELTQLPSWFSQYSVDSPPLFAHLLIQSSDPVLQMTHVIGDKVQFETYSAPCIFLGTKWTALVDDNEARREYEAEFGVPGISSSSTPPPWSFIFSFKIKSKEIAFVSPLVFYHGNGSRISFRLIAVYDWSFIRRWFTIWPSMTHGTADEDIWRMIIGGFPLVLLYDSFTFLTWHILLPF